MTRRTSRTRLTPALRMMLALGVVMVFAGAAKPQPPVIDREKLIKVKAAYIYNFTKYVRWPEDAFQDENAPLVIGVYGDDPFGAVLDRTVKDKIVNRHPIQVRRIRPNSDSEQFDELIGSCHVLFVCDSERSRLDDILEAAKSHQLLTVSDIDQFAARDGMIGFVLDKNRIVFEVNREAVREADLRISAKLLKLARIVKKKPKENGSRTP